MIVAVTLVDMMQSAVNQVIRMVAMGDSRMSTGGPMDVSCVMPFCPFRALVGIGLAYFDGVLIHMVPVHVVQMTIVQIIRVPLVLNGRVSTTGSMLVTVILVLLTFLHNRILSLRG